jgi:hypothetical protein
MEKQMKLSNETLSVLQNFATINAGIKFKKGTKLSTVSPSKSVLAEATLTDSFTDEYCVDDLHKFLSVHSLFKDKPELVSENENIIFKNGRSKIVYRKTADNQVVLPPEKTLTLPTQDVIFTLTDEDYAHVMKTAKVLSSPHVAIQSDGETIEIVTFDAVVDSADINSLEIGEGNGKQYKVVFDINNLKMIPGTYEVVICFKGFAHFKNTKANIQYWVAFESKYTKTKD